MGIERAWFLVAGVEGVLDGVWVGIFQLRAGGESAAERRDFKGQTLSNREQFFLQNKPGVVALSGGREA